MLELLSSTEQYVIITKDDFIGFMMFVILFVSIAEIAATLLNKGIMKIRKKLSK